MFRNIGRKVRTLAKIICWAGILGSLGFGVYAWQTKLLPLLPWCVVIGVGGSLFFLLNSWIIYCIGDTNARLVDATAQAEPRPGYAEYLQSPETMASSSGMCEFCGKESNYLTDAKIVDKLGTRYRKVCPECFSKYNCAVTDK